MPITFPFPIRKECPPGACVCARETLLDAPHGDVRILLLTREEEKSLIARIEHLGSYDDLLRLGERMRTQLGISLRITPSIRGVRTVRGLAIQLAEQAGLCKKTRLAVPAALRKCLENNPEIVYAILNAHDLLGK